MTPNETQENSVKKPKKAKIISAVIICFCAIFALLIAYTFVKQKRGNNDASGAQQTGAAQSSGGAQQSGGPSNTGGKNQPGGRNAAAVRVTPVKLSTIQNSVVITGDVLPRNQVSIFPTVAGKLTEVRLGIGDYVSRGDVVAMIDPSRPGEIYSHSPVISTISGTVLEAPYSIGDTLSTSSAVYTLGDLSSLRVETYVPERFVSSIKLGLSAQVSFQAIPGETFNAVIDEMSPVLNPSSRTLKIRLRFVNNTSSRTDSRIKSGMLATISLVTQTRSNVPVIPRASVISTYGSWIVFTVDENNIARRNQVELGIENEEFIEVLSGIKAGDNVVSAGQNFLTDGDPVRIVD